MTEEVYDLTAGGEATNDPTDLTNNPDKEGFTMADKAVAIHDDQTQHLPADPMVSMIERVATDPNADLAKLERMLELKERHEAQSAKAAFARAFAEASAEFPTIPLNGRGHNGKAYATLKDITAKTRPVLSKHGLALSFSIDVGEAVVVTAELMHEAGHSKTTSIALPRETSGSKNAVQAVGSSQTYGQRYTAQAILGLSLGDDTEDDAGATSGPETVSAEQYVALRDKAAEAGVDEAKICMAAGVSDLHQFPVKDFNAAMSRLNKNIAANSNA